MVPTLNLSARLAYAVPGFVFALVGIPIYVHLPKFYGDALGVDLRVIGLAILASRIWDAVTDPAVGYLSDHTRSRWGRRRPWIAAGALPLAAAVALLLAPPAADVRGTGLWMTVLLFVAFLAWTSIQIPHAALGAELAPDYHARTSLYAWRDALFILGTLGAAAAPAVIRAAGGFPLTPDGERSTFKVLAALYAPLLLLLPLWCAAVLREPAVGGRTSSAAPWRATREALRNEPFRIVLVAYAIGALGSALPGTLILFYVEHVLGAPGQAEIYLALYFLVGFVCLPLWPWLARRIGKKQAWLGAMLLSIGAFSGAAFLDRGQTLAFGAIVLVSGIGLGASFVLPSSLVADAIDFDEVRSGERREGLYFGLWSIVSKASAALGPAVALPTLQWAGYVANGEQPESVRVALRLLYAAVPCLCYLAAMVVAVRFPIDEARHAEIRATLSARASRGPRADLRPAAS
jgi:GPH family glycoside/pentoside/hexuronide:cation symporter